MAKQDKVEAKMFYTHIREEDLELYVLGRLSPKQAPAIRSHLAKCEICKNKLTEVEISKVRLADLGKRQGSEGKMALRRNS